MEKSKSKKVKAMNEEERLKRIAQAKFEGKIIRRCRYCLKFDTSPPLVYRNETLASGHHEIWWEHPECRMQHLKKILKSESHE